MASSTKVRELIRRVSTLLLDTDPQFNLFREADIVDALNDGIRAIVMYAPFAGARVDSIRLDPGALQSIDSVPAARIKLADGTSPSAAVQGLKPFKLLNNMGANGTTPGMAIGEPVDQRIIDAQDPMWMTTTGTTVYSWSYDPATPKQFLVQPPVPSDTQVWVRMSWCARPAEIPNTGTVGGEIYKADGVNNALIPIDDEWADDLMHYAIARMHMTSSEAADMGKAQVFASAFTSSINAKVTALTGYNPNLQRLPFAPEPVGEAK